MTEDERLDVEQDNEVAGFAGVATILIVAAGLIVRRHPIGAAAMGAVSLYSVYRAYRTAQRVEVPSHEAPGSLNGRLDIRRASGL
ncbi:hypothetical protein MBUL_04459 (plasmid) [Methylobacterium bullatum]|uniref:Uncharacterized protein n=1 Tax=Methylobacterium bullatum TaxID=570505 RepID=A0A679JC64_9HYPH|nr:hypothetical protein MBUL_04459 [Methylobacterium bullatum]